MPYLTLRFVRGKAISSRLIQWRAWGHWSHVELLLPDGSGYLGARFPDGVQIKPVGYDLKSIAEEDFGHVEMSVQSLAASLNWAQQQIGVKYDLLGDFGFVVREKWASPKRLFCSEYMFNMCLAGGNLLLRTLTPWKLSPSDLYLSTRIVSEGFKIPMGYLPAPGMRLL